MKRMTPRRLLLAVALVVLGVVVFRWALGSALYASAGRGDLLTAKILLKLGANVNARVVQDETPLMNAAVEGRTEMVQFLLSRDADIHAVSANNETALGRAVVANKIETVRLLLAGGADIEKNSTANVTPLMLAASIGDIELVSLLLSKGASVRSVDDSQETALVHAVTGKGSLDIIRMLIATGADPNAKDFHGRTVIQLARERNRMDLILFLERAGAL